MNKNKIVIFNKYIGDNILFEELCVGEKFKRIEIKNLKGSKVLMLDLIIG